jgi:RNA polymerase sigma-70 factor (ECF subfamily)
MNIKNEMEVIELTLNGNNRASEQLYKLIRGIIKNQLYYCSIYGAESHELSHDLTVKVFDKLYTFKPDYHLKPWVERITRNALIDLYRFKKNKSLVVSLEEPYNLNIKCTDVEDLETLLIKEEQSKYLEAIISELNPKDKSLINLYYFEQFSQKKLANELNTTVSALNSKLNRIRRQLRKNLACMHMII